jgi:hypothetical protein
MRYSTNPTVFVSTQLCSTQHHAHDCMQLHRRQVLWTLSSMIEQINHVAKLQKSKIPRALGTGLIKPLYLLITFTLD